MCRISEICSGTTFQSLYFSGSLHLGTHIVAQTNRTHQKDGKGTTETNTVHAASNYLAVTKSGKYTYAKYQACKPYKKYVD